MTLRMIAGGRFPAGDSGYLCVNGAGVPGGVISSPGRPGIIERASLLYYSSALAAAVLRGSEMVPATCSAMGIEQRTQKGVRHGLGR
ncbi:Uncharacterised protein [Mycobacteroides abscessus subsp. abscessus]|nr:Uncharacterised protein [Mycobacteroides abscessus subsp. abscessus]